MYTHMYYMYRQYMYVSKMYTLDKNHRWSEARIISGTSE